MEFTGLLIQKLPVQSGTSQKGEWKSQDIIIETVETYPKKIAINFYGDKINEIEKLNINDDITVTANVESREYNGKWYTKVSAWKVTVNKKADPQPEIEPEYQSAFIDETPTDDMPF